MNGLIAIISSVIVSLLGKLFHRSRTGIDSDVDVGRLRRAGSRISNWLRQSRVRNGVISDASGPKLEDEGVHPGKRRVGEVKQRDHGP